MHENLKSQKALVNKATSFIAKHCHLRPTVGLMTGTGLGDAAEGMEIQKSMDYRDIPHFPVSTVESHPGRLLFGMVRNLPVMAMQGRIHLYEGYTPLQVTFPVRLMRSLGVKYLVLTNAAGGLNTDFEPGDIMCISDHINLMGENPLVGPNADEWGIRFPDMSEAYDSDLRGIASGVAIKSDLVLKAGTYAGLKGPSLETPAEVRFLRSVGADAVGFSTVQEVIAAVHAGMKVVGFSIITNVHDPEAPTPSTVDEIIQVANRAAPELRHLINGVIETLGSHEDR